MQVRMLCWAAMMMIAANAFSAVPASRAPATRPMSDIERWFGQLADTDPQVRDEAKLRLMGLLRGELDALRMIVESNRPLAPAQSAVLRDIVIHVYLSGEPYEKNLRTGFLGAMLENEPFPVVRDEPDQEGRGVSGVLIRETVAGFCAFRYLRVGDVVLGVIASEVYPTPMSPELQMRVGEVEPGETITLLVLRQGKVIRVTFRVDARPLAADPGGAIEEFRNKRMERAEQYWRVVFEPLVTPDGGEVSVRPAVRRTAANG